ncbi:WxL domain-containing protein [Carnobacterium gallinarum]|uniref:WxL domain-containing protein n=1 Tax=Carnobacterium gallinarum TaxID=2749 RepID=UPI000551258A|nr:WxL domain-containing protein [Carnobacterium gallinarum]
MKKKVLAAVLLSGILLPTFASAADQPGVPTRGSVVFEVVGDTETGTVIVPGEEDTDDNTIIPEGGGSSTGPLRLESVPDIKFGTIKFKTGKTTHPALLEEYTKPAEPTVKRAIPHFVQVTDERGLVDGTWKLNVTSTTFKDTAAVAPELINSKIILKQQSFFNSVGDFATPVVAATTLVDGFTGTEATIPTDGTTNVQILSTKTGQTTNGSKTSTVFNSAYLPENLDSYEVNTYNDGVILDKANGDNVQIGVNYESNLIWTLSDSI